MKTLTLSCLLLLMSTELLAYNCNLNRFRWGCDLPAKAHHSANHRSIVRCGAAVVYLTKREYDTLARYQRANVGMALLINGEYADSPCIPINR